MAETSYLLLDLRNMTSENIKINPKETRKTSGAQDLLGYTQKVRGTYNVAKGMAA
jgi:hypothetical protein